MAFEQTDAYVELQSQGMQMAKGQAGGSAQQFGANLARLVVTKQGWKKRWLVLVATVKED